MVSCLLIHPDVPEQRAVMMVVERLASPLWQQGKKKKKFKLTRLRYG